MFRGVLQVAPSGAKLLSMTGGLFFVKSVIMAHNVNINCFCPITIFTLQIFVKTCPFRFQRVIKSSDYFSNQLQ